MATFTTDTLLAQGYDHREIGCQDYALAGVENNYAFAIVCDGCSGSVASDVGARLLAANAKFIVDTFYNNEKLPLTAKIFDAEFVAKNRTYPAFHLVGDMIEKAAKREIRSTPEKPIFKRSAEEQYEIGHEIIRTANPGHLITALGDTFMDATLVLAVVNQDEYHAFMWGDGVIAIETKVNGTKLHEVDFTHGYPYYLSYEIDERRRNEYFSNLGDGPYKNVTTLAYPPSGINNRESRFVLARDPIIFSGPTSDLRNISVASDGLTSFMNPTNSQRVGLQEVWGQFDFTDFNMAGKFMKRKHNLLNRWLKTSGNVHMDDISMATIHVK